MMEPYQQRVVEEQTQLDERLSKLRLFMVGTNPTYLGLTVEERDRLYHQERAMTRYSEILAARIAVFVPAPSGLSELEGD